MDIQEQIRQRLSEQKMAMSKDNRVKEIIAKEMDNALYPFDELSKHWLENAHKSLYFSTPFTLGLPPAELTVLFTSIEKGKISFTHFGVLSNAIESRTPQELELYLSEYATLMEDVQQAAKHFNKKYDKVKEAATKQAEDEQKMQGAAEKGIGNILKPVKAEA